MRFLAGAITAVCAVLFLIFGLYLVDEIFGTDIVTDSNDDNKVKVLNVASIHEDDHWTQGEDGEWIYQGPALSFVVPDGFRVDTPKHSCEGPIGGGGLYHGRKVTNVTKLTVLAVEDETQCPANAVANPTTAPAATTAPNSGNNKPSGGNTNTPAAPCPSTTDVNAAIHSDVQRVGGEACAWTLRVAAIGSTGVVCPAGYLCTLTIGDTFVYIGDGTSYQGVIAGTDRVLSSYPGLDPCMQTFKEDDFGAHQNPMFDVFPGNFQCNGNVMVPGSGPAVANLQSQIAGTVTVGGNTFTGTATVGQVPATAAQAQEQPAASCPTGTSPLNDGTPRCKYGPTTAGDYTVPSGWNAEYWDGSSTQYASGGQTVTTGEATLSPS